MCGHARGKMAISTTDASGWSPPIGQTPAAKHEYAHPKTNPGQNRDPTPYRFVHRLKHLRRFAGLGLLLASFALAGLVIRYQPQVEHFIHVAGPWAYPLAVAVFAVVASAPFSVTDALAIMNGAIFGPVAGSIVNAIGLVFAAMLGYWVNRHATHLLDLNALLERLPAWAKRFRIGSWQFLLAVRVLPGIGGTTATATAAAMRVPMWIHVATMCAIAVPICTLLAVFGDGVTSAVHRYEHSMKVYIVNHRPHFHFTRRPRATATP